MEGKKIAIFPGSFDPMTLGHLDLIERGVRMYDRLVVAVVNNSGKRPFAFTLDERIDMVRIATQSLDNVEVIPLKGLLVDCAKKMSADIILRGLRGTNDFDYEYQMAAANREMTGIETVFICSAPKHSHLSSTLIREIASQGRSIGGFVPAVLEKEIMLRLQQAHQEAKEPHR